MNYDNRKFCTPRTHDTRVAVPRLLHVYLIQVFGVISVWQRKLVLLMNVFRKQHCTRFYYNTQNIRFTTMPLNKNVAKFFFFFF